MDDDAASTCNLLIIRTGSQGFDRDTRCEIGQRRIKRRAIERDPQFAVGIGHTAAVQNRLCRQFGFPPPPTIKANPGIVHITEAVASPPRGFEGIALREHIPGHRGISQRTAEEVTRGDGRLRVLAPLQLSYCRFNHDFKLRGTVGGDLEVSLVVLIIEFDGDGIIAQAGIGI
ncbi:MAG: hypothetical protein BWY63_03342 [Chloroflexi bacterium ADurb.Bin360]|nr:MAG: hypothetical protein BWY63_03342 [Chloroflexi bacterium ADurb.Bin360]